MGKGHANLFELVKTHRADFEQFGKVPFETGASPDSATGQKERFALLNEDQSYLLLTYTRNTERTRHLKIKLVKAFGEARRAAEAGVEYTLVSPQAWKKRVGLIGTDKDAARSRAIQLWPAWRELDAKGKGQALADAALIAMHGG